MFVNVTVEGSLDSAGSWIKVEDDFGAVGIAHEEAICISWEGVWEICNGGFARVFRSSRVEGLLGLFGIDDVDFSAPDDKFVEINLVVDAFVLVPGDDGGCANTTIEDAGNEPDSELITETPEFIVVATGDELDAHHVLDGLMGTFDLAID